MTVSFNQSLSTITVGTDDMRKHMGEILDCVNLRGDEFIINRKHHPLAVLIPFQKHQALTAMARKIVLSTMEKSDNCELSPEEIDTLTNLAKHQSRTNPDIEDVE